MAKKITTEKRNYVQGWGRNEAPYEALVDWFTDDKTEQEKAQIIQEIEESHTYLMICEYGAASPSILELVHAFEAERKDGLIGFVNAIREDRPMFFDV